MLGSEVIQNSKRTAFVLGAGASEPFNFPIGIGLVTEVIDLLFSPERDRLGAFMKIEEREFDVFRNALQFSGKNSVDAFLEHRTDFMGVGKAAMAYVLIKRENPAALFATKSTNWLRYIYDKMNSPFEEFG